LDYRQIITTKLKHDKQCRKSFDVLATGLNVSHSPIKIIFKSVSN